MTSPAPTQHAPAQRGDATREALLSAAVEIFARDGFHAASTRAIADQAQLNQALIGYHFGSKQGLYLAVFDHIAQQLAQRLDPVLASLPPAQAAGTPTTVDPQTDPRQRTRDLASLQDLVARMATSMNQEASTAWAQLILREQQVPTDAFNLLYDRIISRLFDALVGLLRRLHPQHADVRPLALTIVGEALVFRTARAAVLRCTGWQDIGAEELTVIQDQLHRNIAGLLAQPIPDPTRSGANR